MNELALFAGAGGGLLASRLLGWNTIGAVEIEKYPRDVLLQRQRDGMLDQFPIWDDVRTFDGKPWRGLVDVVSGGFPCQDISVAGKGLGLAGERSGLWFEYQRIIEEIRPKFVFAENSPNLRTRGLGTIIEGLTSLGYGVRWGVLGAWHIGANHKRDRMWVLAYADSNTTPQRGEHAAGQKPGCLREHQLGRCGGVGGEGCQKVSRKTEGVVSNSYGPRCQKQWRAEPTSPQYQTAERCCWWETEPTVGRVVNGVASGLDVAGTDAKGALG